MTNQQLETLKRLIEVRLGQRPAVPTDFSRLALSIYKVTGNKLSVSTIKRLWGYVTVHSSPSISTLDILSRYVGYTSWNKFLESGTSSDISYFTSNETLDAAKLPVGSLIRIAWDPDRECLLKLTGAKRFEVIEATNAKLQVGDRFTAHIFSRGEPLFCSEITRDSKALPLYVAARSHGLTKVEVRVPFTD